MATELDIYRTANVLIREHGEPVNLSARLEALNKEYGTQILIDAATVERLPDVPLQEIGHVTVRGFSEPAAVFTPTAETGPQLRRRAEAGAVGN